ncbi:hypothetical protein FA10DRAFT_262980 [Acaromyces ingoldii]|uniref:Uncharacterized protein n=1 Tax=Acaromyces ingoldii TaxID=215250 RepID=A0A316YCM6_9BASI|nr:hypothetical protein FA10DRAFT_262980 [Acaromyces ingoldii]PWN87246.1 hypothetical protein FA10DRAFT_262980 [Acaromyces ingoldii]
MTQKLALILVFSLVLLLHATHSQARPTPAGEHGESHFVLYHDEHAMAPLQHAPDQGSFLQWNDPLEVDTLNNQWQMSLWNDLPEFEPHNDQWQHSHWNHSPEPEPYSLFPELDKVFDVRQQGAAQHHDEVQGTVPRSDAVFSSHPQPAYASNAPIASPHHEEQSRQIIPSYMPGHGLRETSDAASQPSSRRKLSRKPKAIFLTDHERKLFRKQRPIYLTDQERVSLTPDELYLIDHSDSLDEEMRSSIAAVVAKVKLARKGHRNQQVTNGPRPRNISDVVNDFREKAVKQGKILTVDIGEERFFFTPIPTHGSIPIEVAEKKRSEVVGLKTKYETVPERKLCSFTLASSKGARFQGMLSQAKFKAGVDFYAASVNRIWCGRDDFSLVTSLRTILFSKSTGIICQEATQRALIAPMEVRSSQQSSSNTTNVRVCKGIPHTNLKVRMESTKKELAATPVSAGLKETKS